MGGNVPVTTPQPIFIVLNQGTGQGAQVLQLPTGPTSVPLLRELLQGIGGGGVSTTTEPPLSSTTPPVDIQDLQNLRGSIFEDDRNSGVSVKPLGVQTPFQTISNGFNAIVTPVPNTLDTTTLDGVQDVFRPFDFSARPQIQLTTLAPAVTEFPTDPTTTDAAGFNVHLNHFGVSLNHSTVPGEPSLVNIPVTTSIPTQDVQDEKKLQETILDILAENIDHPMKDQVVNKIKEDISIKEITTAAPVGPNFERLGPHIVPKVFRPNAANVVEAQIHKTYEGQEFIGEDTLESLGNDITNLVYYI